MHRWRCPLDAADPRPVDSRWGSSAGAQPGSWQTRGAPPQRSQRGSARPQTAPRTRPGGRGAIEWHYHAAGSPPPGDAWDGAKGLVAEIADRMGLEPHSGRQLVKLGERTGRRKYLRLPHHADCDDAVAARAKKYRDFHAAEVRKMVVESSESESEDD